ncbi:MAG: hypothetical protein P1V51_01500 [Deltaproteobacteria bacterium]|nr:hypothetical protein [Deltaproteobacteria bacterium]
MSDERRPSPEEVTDPDRTDPRAERPERRPEATDPGSPAPARSTDPTPGDAEPTRMEAPPTSRPPKEAPSTDPTPADAEPTRMEAPPTSRPPKEAPSSDPTPANIEPTRLEPPPTSRPSKEAPSTDPTPANIEPTRLEAPPTSRPPKEAPSTDPTPANIEPTRLEAPPTSRAPKAAASTDPTPADAEPTFRGVPPAARPATGDTAVPSLAQLRESRRQRRPSDRVIIALAALGGVAVLLAAFALTRRETVDPHAELQERHARAEQIYVSGMEAFRAEEWERAEAAFAEAVSLHPRHEKAKDYLDASRREREAALALADAARLLEQGDLAAATTALARVRRDSILAGQAEELQKRIDGVKLAGVLDVFHEALAGTDPMAVLSALEAAAGQPALERARRELTALEAISLDAAAEQLTLARERAPDAADVRVAQRQLEARREAITTAISLKKVEIRELEGDAEDAEARRIKEAIERTLRPARAAFERGALGEAGRILKAGPARADDLPEVRRAVKAARDALPRYQRSITAAQRSEKQRDLSSAATHYTQAHQAARKIDAGGTPTQTALEGAVRTRYLAGRAAFNAEKWPEAFAQWSQGGRLDPSDANLSRGLKDLDAKAKELYLQAYVNKPSVPERARRGFQLVLKMTPPGSEWNRKSREQLAELGGP